MGWRELCDKNGQTQAGWLNHLRAWLLVVLVSWMAGWGLIDMTLRQGAVQVAAVEVGFTPSASFQPTGRHV